MIKVFENEKIKNLNDIKIQVEFIELLYKKLKLNYFYDKNLRVPSMKLVLSGFENNFGEFKVILENVFKGDNTCLKELFDEIQVIILPKKEKNKEEKNKEDKNKENIKKEINLLSNEPKNNIEYEYQIYVDLPLELQLIGIAWILLFGYKLDDNLCSNSFGNRLSDMAFSNKNAGIKNMSFTNSNFLFKPYFQNYESWQKGAYNTAKELLDKGHNCIVSTFDITRYYYSVNCCDDFREDVLNHLEKDVIDNLERTIIKNVTLTIFEIIDKFNENINKYKDLIKDNDVNISIDKSLPIGFYPSNILGNYFLNKFDLYVLKEVKPDYYGRYVDDIIVVEKTEHIDCIRDGIDPTKIEKYINRFGIEKKNENQEGKINYKLKDDIVYNSKLYIKKDKLTFNFFNSNYRHDTIDEIIKYFDSNEAKFNYLNDEEVDYVKDSLDIYKFSREITKFNQLCDIQVDKFKFSVSLSQYKKYLCLVGVENQSANFKELLKVLQPNILISNYNNIGKLLDIFLLSLDLSDEYIDEFLSCLERAIDLYENISIDSYDDISMILHKYITIVDIKKQIIKKQIITSFKDYLKSVFLFSVMNFGGKKVKDKVFNFMKNSLGMKDVEKSIDLFRELNMYDKSLCSIYFPIVYIDSYETIRTFDNRDYYSIAKYETCLEIIYNRPTNYLDMTKKFKFLPVHVKPHELAMIIHLCEMIGYDESTQNIAYNNSYLNLLGKTNSDKYNKKTKDDIITYYEDIYKTLFKEDICFELSFVNTSEKKELNVKKVAAGGYTGGNNSLYGNDDSDDNNGSGSVYIKLSEKNGRKNKIKIAISNIQGYFDLHEFCRDKKNRSVDRYSKISKLVNHAIEEKVDFLVMPEACMPYEWISYFSNILIKNGIALITGVEPVINDKKYLFNFVANILPFKVGDYSYGFYIPHLKNYYAPIEINEYNAKGFKEVVIENHQLINYNNFYYKIHLCYELAILEEREYFFDCIDACFAVELNPDIHYFESIVDSFARDLHCYVIQVNDSSHGDCRITAPKSYECKDLIKVKGGKNATILVDEIDVKKLREFQYNTILQQYQMKNKEFKLTPTNYRSENAKKRMDDLMPDITKKS